MRVSVAIAEYEKIMDIRNHLRNHLNLMNYRSLNTFMNTGYNNFIVHAVVCLIYLQARIGQTSYRGNLGRPNLGRLSDV